ncbi:MAG TPA: adenylate/guanylate cyclase domain-containing protein [Candidatus Dormibacteraeota bacterium]|nr:adenylate/guanylate cyclase domain-containing protein [Candidatus Dormibacteraeota bacterium]
MAVSTEERRIVTVLFADLVNSTALGERLDPEEMRALLQRYYDIARESVQQHGGTVEKFIGDAVMAVFGLPTAHGDDPDRAVAAALTIRDRVKADLQLGDRLAIRFGVSTGEVVASRDQSAGDFLITGDATNVAARLQQAADPGAILVSDRTVGASSNFDFGDKVEVRARGKSAPVRAHPVIGPKKARAQGRVQLPLIGRETDLAQLQLVARRAVTEKRPSMVSVIAPAGVGKTRLVEEFLTWLPTIAPNATVATAQCLPYGQQLTYWPMRQVLFTLTGTTEDTPPATVREAIGTWLRGIGVENADRDARLLAATIGEGGTEGVDKDLLFAAWRSALEATARRNPLVIVFEDLHWSSESLLDLAQFVMQPRGEAAVLMIVLARPELLDRRPNWGGGRLNHLAIALEPLPNTAIADLVRHLLETDQPEVVKLVSERADGNPFYAGELVRSYLEHGSLERLPDTVQATVLARLDTLPSEERRVLQLGSVFGRAFRAAGVAALEQVDITRVAALCENLIDRDLIRAAETDRYTFRHILIQEVAYSTLPRAERARLHAQAARWGESIAGEREVALAEILAFHYREAAVLYTALEPNTEATQQLREQAARWLLRAADVAAAAAATPEAVRHIRAAFDFVDASRLPRLHERIGDLTAGDSGLEEYRLALEGYEAANCPVDDQLRALAGMLMIAMRWVGSVGDRPSEAWLSDVRERGNRLLKKVQDKVVVARFLAADAFFPFWIQSVRDPTEEELERAGRNAARALEIARELDNADLASVALDASAVLAQAANDWATSREMAYQRIALEPKLNFYERLDAHSMVAWMSYLLGDLETAEKDSAEMAARILPGQAPYPALGLYVWRALILYTLGRWDDAVAIFWRSVEAWHDAGSHAAGYGLRGFIVGLDIGRARGDARLSGVAMDAIESIVTRFSSDHYVRIFLPYLHGDPAFTDDDQYLRIHYPADVAERRLSLASDLRKELSKRLLDGLLARAVDDHLLLLEAQVHRARGLAFKDPAEMSAAIDVWERVGAVPQLGRGRAELGLLNGDAAETEAGLAILKRLGDADYVDRFRLSLA